MVCSLWRHLPPAVVRRLRHIRRLPLAFAGAAALSCCGCLSLPAPAGFSDASSGHTACATCAAPAACPSCGVSHDAMSTGEAPLTAPRPPSHVVNSGPPACQPVPAVPYVPPESDPIASVSRECEQQVARLKAQLDALESTQHDRIRTYEQTMRQMQQDLRRLNDDVQYWKSEVTRLDHEATAQHEQDLQSLDSLLDLLEQIPTSSGPNAAPGSSAPPAN